LLKENHILKNRELHIHFSVPEKIDVNVPVNVSVNDVEKSVLMIISENVNITYEEIAEKIKKDRKTVQRAIRTLKEKDLIFRVGSDKTGHWEVNESLLS
jgi:ATP-dependent DNA helicase RecG